MGVVLLAAALLASWASLGHSLELNAKSAFVYHPATGTVLVAQNADQKMGPASLTKMLTLYLTFEALKQGRLQLTDPLPVSEKAWRMGGSKMFVEVGKTADVESLIRGVAIVSGNDACVVLAEKLGGTEEGFVGMMNQKAAELGMKNSTFTNSNGWPSPQELTTARDMALLLTAIFRDFPEYQKYLAEEEFVFNGIKQQNRNGLLHANAGVDAGKTGHTEESGYHLAATATQNGERLVSVVMGTDGFAAREGETLKAFRTFFASHQTVNLFRPGDAVVAGVPAWGGPKAVVNLTVPAPLAAYLSADEKAGIKAQAMFNAPVRAPLSADQPVGEVRATLADGRVVSAPLVVEGGLPQGNLFTRFVLSLANRVGL